MEGKGNSIDLEEILGPELVRKTETGAYETVPCSQLVKGKTVGIYFSAHWCPPCRAFTPSLKRLYHLFKAHKKGFEVVFVSSDRSEDQFKEYFDQMPWIAIPYDKRRVRESLARAFGVMGIPTLAIISPDGKVLSYNARAAVMQDPQGEKFPWEGMEEPGSKWWQWVVMAIIVWAAWTLLSSLTNK